MTTQKVTFNSDRLVGPYKLNSQSRFQSLKYFKAK